MVVSDVWWGQVGVQWVILGVRKGVESGRGVRHGVRGGGSRVGSEGGIRGQGDGQGEGSGRGQGDGSGIEVRSEWVTLRGKGDPFPTPPHPHLAPASAPWIHLCSSLCEAGSRICHRTPPHPSTQAVPRETTYAQ